MSNPHLFAKLAAHKAENLTSAEPSREKLLATISVDFTEEELSGGRFLQVDELLEAYDEEELSLHEVCQELGELRDFLETGLEEHLQEELSENAFPILVLSNELLEESFRSWIVGLTDLELALIQDKESDIDEAKVALLEANQSSLRLALLLAER